MLIIFRVINIFQKDQNFKSLKKKLRHSDNGLTLFIQEN